MSENIIWQGYVTIPYPVMMREFRIRLERYMPGQWRYIVEEFDNVDWNTIELFLELEAAQKYIDYIEKAKDWRDILNV